MSGRTISAYTDEATATRLAYLAKIEDRSPAQIAAAALRFYTGLPPEAHQALRRIEAMESPELLSSLQREVTRTVLHALFDGAEGRMVKRAEEGGVADTASTEDDLLAEAVRLTTRRR
jgi:hypothetical protein